MHNEAYNPNPTALLKNLYTVRVVLMLLLDIVTSCFSESVRKLS